MKKILVAFLLTLVGALIPGSSSAGTFTACEQYSQPTPFDPAVTNSWGSILNQNFALIDSAQAGILNLNVAGSSNVFLTSIAGAADQARNRHFNFTGALTGNIIVFWPNGLCRDFIVTNNTSGAFTLTLAVNNGAGSPAGSTLAIAPGATIMAYSDGGNIIANTQASATPVGPAGGDLGGNYPNPSVLAIHLPAPIPVVQGGTGRSDSQTLLPPGVIMAYVATGPPAGWIVCDGSAVSRSTFANLFAVIGTTYGPGDGSTTFNVPDLRGRFMAGYDPGNSTGRLNIPVPNGITAAALSNVGGQQDHSLTQGELPNYNLPYSDPGHAHLSATPSPLGGGSLYTNGSGPINSGSNGASTSVSGVGITINSGGGNQLMNLVPPAIIVQYIIKS